MSKSVFGRRRNLTCFFCGHRTSVVTSEPYVKQFTCTSPYCQSVNNLDESGNIVDYIPSPQPHVPPPAPRYGRPVRSPSPQIEDPSVSAGGSGGGDSPVFCKTCQKHLSIKHNILADYLPPEDDPEFDVYWTKLPEFKKSLEEKYPEPCGPCSLRASQRIKEANYLAKAAVIGRLLEQSQNMKPAYYMEPWGLSRMVKLVLWLLRGMGWFGIHLLVIVWHATMLLYPIPLHDPVDITGTWVTCASKSLGEKKVDIACYEASSLLAKSALPWSWICLFWNYQALACTRHQNAKLIGMEEFMKCELFLFLARIVAWFLLSPGRVRVDSSPDALKAWSFGFLTLAIVGFLYSMTTLKITKPTPINLRECVSPLRSCSPNLKPRFQHHPNNSFLSQKEPCDTPLPPPRQPFFAPTSMSQQSTDTFPSTSSFSRAKPQNRLDGPFPSHSVSQPQYQRVSYDGADTMDWNPTSSPRMRLDTNWARASTNNLSSNTILSSPVGQSPFSMGIPQKPRTSMFEALVSGQTQQKQQQQQQQQLATPLREYFQANGRSSIGTSTTGIKYPPMAEPKFFPKSVAEGEDTGLEGLISGSLKLEDEPEVIRTARAQLVDHHDSWRGVVTRLVIATLACGLFAYFGVSVSNATNEVVPYFVGPILEPQGEESHSEVVAWGKLAALALAGLCSVWGFMGGQNHTSKDPHGSGLLRLILASERIVGVLLLIFTARATDIGTAEVLGKLYVGWVFAREMFNLISLLQHKGHSHALVRKAEQEPPSRREVSPGLGEWPLPPELRSKSQQTPAARTAPGLSPVGTGRGRAILRRDGSSSLSISEGISGFGGLKREGSGALAGMVRDAGTVKAGNVPMMRREGGLGSLRLS